MMVYASTSAPPWRNPFIVERRRGETGTHPLVAVFLVPAMVLLASLLGGLCDSVHLESDRSLCHQSAVHRCASIHGDQRFTQHDALTVRGRSNGDTVSDLPEDVLGQCAACQGHPLSVGLVQLSRDLEDPNVIRAARECDIR